MDLKRLPFVPIHYFLTSFSNLNRILFGILLIGAILAGGLAWFNYANPTYWSMEVVELADSEVVPVQIETIEHRYREIPIELNAYRQLSSFVAGPLVPAKAPVMIFWALQIIAWSIFLGVVTQIRSRWVYAFYLLFVLFLTFTGVESYIWPATEANGADPFFLVRLGLLVAFLGSAYAFQMFLLRWKLPWRILTFFVFNLTMVGLVYLQSDWIGLQEMAANEVPYMGILALIFSLFIAKEPINLILLATTNRQERRFRLALPFIILLMMIWLLLTIGWVDELFPLNLMPWFRPDIRPHHVLIIGGLVTVFTSQHLFKSVKTVFTTQSVFTLVILSLVVIVSSFMMLNYSYTDLIFNKNFDRYTTMFFAVVSLGYITYLFYNFMPLLRHKINLYYLLGEGPKIPYFIIFMFGVAGFLIAEGPTEGFQFQRMLIHNTLNQKADNLMIAGETQAAIAAYKRALPSASRSVKAHYNIASLLLANPKMAQTSRYHYRQSTESYDFPFSRINAANLFVVKGKLEAAVNELQKARSAEAGNAYLANNLGTLYLKLGLADSAIKSFQKALKADPNASSTYSNLAQVYQRFDRPENATAFYQASLELDKPSNLAMTNALQYALISGEELDIEREKVASSNDFFLHYNWALNHFETGELIDPMLIKDMSRKNGSPDAAVLDAWRMFQNDSIEYAVSRMEGLAKVYPSYAARGYMLLGSGFFKRDVPEMAREYFQRAGNLGIPKGKLFGAKMELDLGLRDSAFAHLSSVRVEDLSLWEASSRELSLLYLAIGQSLLSETEWPSTDHTQSEWTRTGIYADSLGAYLQALEAFRMVQTMDSNSVAPYLELGRIANRHQDPFAIENLEYGRQLADSNN
ncbi:MAG: tetratricopeptide repeat protein, partial [Bacteroidia bacterium]